jgi:orotidine-5'-phosphate decarboxylase
MQARERLIVALDLPERKATVDLARRLAGHVAMVKVGLEPYTAHGPDLVRELIDSGLDVFLDLKAHDIPRTAAAAVREASRLGARLVTIHALGGPEMVRAACDGCSGKTEVIAVTLLTSMDAAACEAVGVGRDVAAGARRLGALALEHGAHGLVCSALELEALNDLGGSRVVPGIRPTGTAAGDQRRVATPAAAIAAGATWLVVGRPIVKADDPVAAARAIAGEIDGDAA